MKDGLNILFTDGAKMKCFYTVRAAKCQIEIIDTGFSGVFFAKVFIFLYEKVVK